jgi:hypothetical protein
MNVWPVKCAAGSVQNVCSTVCRMCGQKCAIRNVRPGMCKMCNLQCMFEDVSIAFRRTRVIVEIDEVMVASWCASGLEVLASVVSNL